MAGCGKQAAKWNFARAMNLAEAGRLDEAIELMESALQQAPGDQQIKLSLANLLAENGQGELGIGHCDEILESNPSNKLAHQIRSTCLQYLGRFDQSLCDYKRCLSGHVSRSPVERNNLAYYRALARKDLSKAALDIQSAIESEEGEYWGCSYVVPLQVRTAVAAGLIARHIGQHDDVLQPLNAKIDQYENGFAIQDAMIKSLITQKMHQHALLDETLRDKMRTSERLPAISQDSLFEIDLHADFPFGEELEKGLLNARSIKQVHANCLGLMLATRALIHEDMHCYRSVDKDRRRVQELGFDFAELAKELPSDEACLATLRKASLYLDTRGFVSGRRDWIGEPASTVEVLTTETASALPGKPQDDQVLAPEVAPSNYREALEDLNFAVLAAQYMELALNSSLYNSPELSAHQIEQKKKMATRMTAVLLYHRMEVHLRKGNKRAADDDQRSIERLGFQPGASLF